MRLNVENIFSGYRQVPVIKEVSFQLEEGQITGLIGLNGAGKSTLMKTILGLIQPYQGEIRLNGHTIEEDHEAYAGQIAYIPETPILYDSLTLDEHLEMTALGYGLPIEEVKKRAQPLLDLFRLGDKGKWFPTHFSKGMKQKVMVVCALVTEASLLIIDEPFLGLDPLAIRDFTRLLLDLKAQGKTILLTTHILSLAPQLCDNYLLLQAGQIVGRGSLDDLGQAFGMAGAALEEIYIHMTEGGRL